MSDVLSGLDTYDINPLDLGNMYENPEGGGQYVVKDDVREALRNPTDGQVDAIYFAWRRDHYPIDDLNTGQIKCRCGDRGDREKHRIRVFLAAAAGGGDERA